MRDVALKRRCTIQQDAWIDIVPDEQVDGLLADLYAKNRDRKSGKVDNILRVHSLNPQSLADHVQLYRNTMHATSGLSHAEREMMAVVVSSINECHY